MLRMITEMFVRVLDLVEAEARNAKQATKRTVFDIIGTVAVVLAGCALFVLGAGALSGALYLVLAEAMPPAGALAIIGGVLLLLACVCGLVARTMTTRN